MNAKQANLTRMFLGTATQARTDQGAWDADLVPALLASAHAIAMRGDPTWQRISEMFDEADEAAA